MKCLLVNYSGYPKSLNYFCPDNGLAQLMANINCTEHEAFVIDYCSLYYVRLWGDFWEESNEEYSSCLDNVLSFIISELSDFVEQNSIDIVGFKLWTGEGFRGSILIAESLRIRFPKLIIIAGGPHVDYFGEIILERTRMFDCLVVGEGEISLIRIIDNLYSKEIWGSIPNLIFNDGNKAIHTQRACIENLDNNSSPIYHPKYYLYIEHKLNFFVIEDTRGCPNNCNFCIEPHKSGNVIRTRSVGKIIDDINLAMSSLNSNGFRFSCSTPLKSHRMILAKKLISSKVRVKYATFQTVKNFDISFAKLLVESGCYNVFIGVESFSNNVLKNSFGKNQSYEEIIRAINNSKRVGLYTQIGLIYPSPIDSEKSKLLTRSSTLVSRPDSVFVLCPFVIPQTAWGKDPSAYNIDIYDVQAYYQISMDYDIKHTDNEIKWTHLNGIKVNGKSHTELIAEVTDVLEVFTKSGIETQISIELPILARLLDKRASILNMEFNMCLTSFNTIGIENIIQNINALLTPNK